MQVTNNIYTGYSQTSTVSKNESTTETSFASMLTNSDEVKEEEKIGRHLKFMDQYNVFEDLSDENRKQFREILKDDKVTMSEIDSLSYEQAEIFMDYSFPLASLPKEELNKAPIVHMPNQAKDMLFAARTTNDRTFNEALYKTAREIYNDDYRMTVLSDVRMNISQAHFTYGLFPSFNAVAPAKNQWDWDLDNMNIDFDKFLSDIISMHEDAISNPPNQDPQFIIQHQERLDGYSSILKHYNDIKNKTNGYA